MHHADDINHIIGELECYAHEFAVGGDHLNNLFGAPAKSDPYSPAAAISEPVFPSITAI